MSEEYETLRRIRELLAEARAISDSGSGDEQRRAAYLERKAAVLDEIAAQTPHEHDRITGHADRARADARAARRRSGGDGG